MIDRIMEKDLKYIPKWTTTICTARIWSIMKREIYEMIKVIDFSKKNNFIKINIKSNLTDASNSSQST